MAHTLRSVGFDASEDGTGRGTPLVSVAENDRNQPVGVLSKQTTGDGERFLATSDGGFLGAFDADHVGHDLHSANSRSPVKGDLAGPLGGGNDGVGRRSEDDPNFVAYSLRRDPGGTGQGHNTNYVTAPASVRRLTPVECERLQALPDGWTDLGGTADSKRYAALGDAVTASVGEWIGAQLLQYIQSERAA